ncbi:MAG TPA: hypothetical protein VF773_03795 [Verrucomicrobiae bacterium]
MKANRTIRRAALAAAFACGLSLVAQTPANPIAWTGTTGDFFDPTKWAGGTVPGSTDIAVINNAGTATIGATAGARSVGLLQIGGIQGGTESGHVIMNGGTLTIGAEDLDLNQVLIGEGTVLSTFIMNGGTIMLDGPDQGGGNTSFKGVNEIDWEVGLRGLGRFEMHNDAKFFASDDLKVAENAAGSGSVLMDGNSYLAVGSGISISSGGQNEQILTLAGNARADSGNSMGAGNPQGGTDEGYLTLAIGNGRGTLNVQDNAIINIRRLSAREGVSTVAVKNRGQFHIFDVLTGAGTNAASRPAETGPNSTFGSANTSSGTFTLQDDAVMTVNSDPASGPTKGLGISAQRDGGNPGGNMKMIIRDRASLTIEQDLMLGTGADAETSSGTLEIVGPSATVNIKGNLNMAVGLDGVIAAVDDNGAEAPGTSILHAVITGPTHTAVQVGGTARIANGQLKVSLNGYAPAAGTTYTLVDGGTIDGQFLTNDFSAAPLHRGLSWQVEYAADAVRLKVVASPLGRVRTVTTANNVNPPAGTVSLLQALTGVQNGDTIRFNIPGAGPHFIATPVGGYPIITNDNVTIDGYSQPSSAPNSNPILAANNAQLRIVLDSRNGNARVMDFDLDINSSGYGTTEAAVIGIYAATNIAVSGLSILSVPWYDNIDGEEVSVYAISFAKAASGYVSGNWIGIAPDGTTLAAPKNGLTAFAWRVVNTDPRTLSTNIVVGVQAGSTNAPAEFNVFCGIPSIPMILESEGSRISGNFINVFPSGVRDFHPALADPVDFFDTFEGNIEIGRSGNNTVIGVNGDGINDSNERNIFSGVLPPDQGGYEHNIEFYGQTPGTNIVIAGNYFGLGIDGTTRFTNGVPVLNAAGGTAQYRFGSDFDGVSDALEANVAYNNWPTALFPTTGSESFFDELSATAIVGARGNVLVNNFPFPTSPLKNAGQFWIDYYTKALVDPSLGVVPVISSSTATRLIGTVPVANAEYPVTIVDIYLADPEGIAYGQTAAVPELPNGYVQGRTYLGSFVDNSSADANPAAGAFDFNISSLNASGLLTVTANYSQQPAGTHNPITLTSPFSEPFEVVGAPVINASIAKTATGVRITWTGGTAPFTVLKKTNLTDATWTPVTTTSDRFADVPTPGAHGFFLVRSGTP